MIRSIFYTSLIIFSTGCLGKGDANSNYSTDPTKIYKLQVSPEPGSKYHFDIFNETKMNLEVNGKEVENTNRSTIASNYDISKDSSGNLLLTLKFDKINIYSKTGDNVKDLNSDKSYSLDPSEKLLSVLKETTFQSTLNKKGEVQIISGIDQISDKIIAAFPATDPATRAALESQWNKIIGEKFVKQNTTQLFHIVPDTTVHVGSTWKTSTSQQDELPIMIENLFTVRSINAETTVIKCEGTIKNTNSQGSITGIGENVKASLEGDQQGEYEIETKTGMVIKSQVKLNLKGTVEVMGKQIPIKIKTTVKIDGKKTNG